MHFVTVWSNGKRALASGYRRVFLISEGTKWHHIFEAHTNTHMKMRKTEYDHLLVKEEVLNKVYWTNYVVDKLHINKYYRDIFEYTATEDDMSLQVMKETLAVLKEIRDLLTPSEAVPYTQTPDLEADVMELTTDTTAALLPSMSTNLSPGEQHTNYWESINKKQSEYNESLKESTSKKMGRPKGAKNKKK